MAYTQTDLDNIQAAITSGELTVTVQGRSITYRSVSELLRIQGVIESELAAQRPQGAVRTGYFTFQTLRGRR